MCVTDTPFEFDSRPPLISVFDQVGHEIGQFGSRLEANSGAFNDVDIVATDEGIYVAWKTFPMITKYSKSGLLIFEHLLDYEPMREFGRINKAALIKDGRIRIMPVIYRIWVGPNHYYVLRAYPRLEILKVDLSGTIKAIYWKDIPFEYVASGFFTCREDGKQQFYILERSPAAQIGIYSIKGKSAIGRSLNN